jgi:hypothetical protein
MSQAVHDSYVKSLVFRGIVNNSTEGDFIIPVPQANEPVSVDSSSDPSANTIVVDCGGSEVLIYPFGTDADNEAFVINIYLWQKCAASSTTTSDLWIPMYVGGATCTLSSALNGVAGGLISDTEFLADTVVELATNTWDDGYTPARIKARSFAGDQLAEIRVDTAGYSKLEVRFDMTTAASGNVLYRQK